MTKRPSSSNSESNNAAPQGKVTPDSDFRTLKDGSSDQAGNPAVAAPSEKDGRESGFNACCFKSLCLENARELAAAIERERLANMRADQAEEARDAAQSATTAREAALQAKIDRLMLEYCPEEMTPEQIAEWKKHQMAATPEAEAALEGAIASVSSTAKREGQ